MHTHTTLISWFIYFIMHTKSETMAALTPLKLPKMLKVIDIDIEIMGAVNFFLRHCLFMMVP